MSTPFDACSIDDRIRIQVELALTGAAACTEARAQQECSARAAGLSGAEIDAARDRRCFDLRAHAAVVLACALRSTLMPTAALLASPLATKARRAGLSDTEIEAINALAQAGRSLTRTETPQ